MNRIVWMAVFTVLAIIWGAFSLFPIEGQRFDQYIEGKATQNVDEFNALLAKAKMRLAERAAQGRTVTLLSALREVVREDNVDLSRFFDIPVADIPNRQTRNGVILSELLKRASGQLSFGLDLQGGVSVTFELNAEELGEEHERAGLMEKAVTIIRERVDGLGVAEPSIRVIGDNRIEVQMPGLSTRDDPEAYKSISAPARLSFHQVYRQGFPQMGDDLSEPAPAGYQKMLLETEDADGNPITQAYWVTIEPDMEGDSVARAYASTNQIGGWVVLMNFTPEGGEMFANVTRRMAQENQRTNSLGLLAIVLDGKLVSAPSVRNEISGGSAEISGRFTQREALELANALSNPLAVGMRVVESTEVSPGLAEDARNASLTAAVIAGTFVVLAVSIYYGLGGIIASFAVLLNVFLTAATLASFNATLTLPGVAGLVLVIGMGIDGFVLIFERMREELRAGKTLPVALVAGFDKAFSAIFDSNVTTFITALILVWLGTGSVKGFGVTLAAGMLINMFCILVVGRLLLELVIIRLKVGSLFPVKWAVSIDGVPFMNYARPAFIAGGVVVLIGLSSIFIGHRAILGIDFVGGKAIAVEFAQKLDSQEIERVAQAQGIQEVTPVYTRQIGAGAETLTLQTRVETDSTALLNALNTAHPEAKLTYKSESVIGGTVGSEILWSAVWALLASFAGMLVYIALRFEFGYGVGSIGSLLFTSVASLSLFVFLGQVLDIGSGQFTAATIAAVLMVIGYAINDSIVVFDRIRDELKINASLKLADVINLSINRTLSRTLLTGVTTIVSSLILVIFGAGPVVDFSLLFTLGIIAGTFSSIFIASPIFFWYHKGDRKHVEESGFLPSYEWETGKKLEAPAGSESARS